MKKILRLYFINNQNKLYLGRYYSFEIKNIIKDLSLYFFQNDQNWNVDEENFNQIFIEKHIR